MIGQSPEYAYVLWRLSATQGRRPWELSGDALEKLEQQARNEAALILRTVRLPEASRVPADENVVDAVVERMRDRYPTPQEFEQDLAWFGLDQALLRRAVASELRAGIVLEQATEVSVSHEELRAFHVAQHHRMVRPEIRTLRHILITIADDATENSRQAALERIETLKGTVRTPVDFAERALRHSECPTALEGGKLGEVRRGQLYASLEDVAFGLGEGAVSGAVESPLGFHLLFCERIEPARSLTLEEATPAIRSHLEKKMRKERLRRFLSGGAMGPS